MLLHTTLISYQYKGNALLIKLSNLLYDTSRRPEAQVVQCRRNAWRSHQAERCEHEAERLEGLSEA